MSLVKPRSKSRSASSRSPKATRPLGIPTVSDRIAQMVVKLMFEPHVEPHFHPDSYGYRPGKSALDAVGVTRQRCWRRNYVIDLDIKGFFDHVSHSHLMRFLEHRIGVAQLTDGTNS